MNRTELRDALTGLYNHTDDPRLIEEIRKVVEKVTGAFDPSISEASGWTLADLRRCNADRQSAWCPDQTPDLSFRGNELGGEVGEALNVIKKLERERHGWRGSRDTVEHLAEELADVVICADLAALTAGVDLMGAVKAKFDLTSEKVGLPQRLTASPSQASLSADVVRLVIAARIVAFEDQSKEALDELDKASEAFAERVPWNDQPRDETAEAGA